VRTPDSLLSYTHKDLFLNTNPPSGHTFRNPLRIESNHLQARQTGHFPRCVVLGDAHVKGAAAVAQIFGREHRTLLSDEQGT